MTATPAAFLRPWEAGDAVALHESVEADPGLQRQLGAGVPDSPGAAAYLEYLLGAQGAGRQDFAVDVGGTAAGSVGISAIDARHGTAWVSYWLGPAVRGRGLAVRAVAAAVEWALTEGGLFRLELGHRTNNPASCRVAIRAGFRVEGIERAKLRYGSRRFDVETHSRLATDPWPDAVPLPWTDKLPWTALPGTGREPDVSPPAPPRPE